jgi:hypothetical protein
MASEVLPDYGLFGKNFESSDDGLCGTEGVGFKDL